MPYHHLNERWMRKRRFRCNSACRTNENHDGSSEVKRKKKIEESIQSFEKVENMKDGNTTLIKQAKKERTALLAILEQKRSIASN